MTARDLPGRPGAPVVPVYRRCWCACAALVALWATCPAVADAAPSLESFVLSVGGISYGGVGGCTTFMNPAQVGAFFGGGVGIPLDGLTVCHVAGGFDDSTGATGPLTGSRTLSTTWPGCSFTGSAVAQAGYGALSAAAHSVFSGSTSSTTVDGSESFGRCNDDFTFTAPGIANGQPGTARFLVTVTGGLSNSASGTADVELNYQYGPAVYTMFRSQVNSAGAAPFLNSIYSVGLAGFAVVPGAMSGSGQVTTFAHPIVFGTPFAFNLGLFAYTVSGGAPGTTLDSHFDAHISGIVVTGPAGQAVPVFTAVAGSGAVYGPGGVTAVGRPVPGDGAARLSASPNPAGSGTRIRFSLPGAVAARLEIYDPAGRRVRMLSDGVRAAGSGQEAWWDGRDDLGAKLPAGAYFARLSWPGDMRTARVTLVH
jgi:hypothetical protein